VLAVGIEGHDEFGARIERELHSRLEGGALAEIHRVPDN